MGREGGSPESGEGHQRGEENYAASACSRSRPDRVCDLGPARKHTSARYAPACAHAFDNKARLRCSLLPYLLPRSSFLPPSLSFGLPSPRSPHPFFGGRGDTQRADVTSRRVPSLRLALLIVLVARSRTFALTSFRVDNPARQHRLFYHVFSRRIRAT